MAWKTVKLTEVFRQFGSCSCISVQQSFCTRAVCRDRAQSVKVKGVPLRAMTECISPKKKVFFLVFFGFSQCLSSGCMATFLWRPLAGREGRTVLCTDIDQALAGLEARQGLAARDGRQGSTQAHHGGGVVLCCRAHAREEASTDERGCVCSRRGGTRRVYSRLLVTSPVHQAPPFCFPSVLWESESRLISTDSSSVLGKLLLRVSGSQQYVTMALKADENKDNL